MTVTIKDVAREAQVSVATVSRALNGHENVAESVRQQVLATADRLRYQPHAAARTGRPGVLVAVVGDDERLRGQCFGEQGADALDPLRVEPWQVGLGPAGAHGRTLRNGRTSTRA